MLDYLDAVLHVFTEDARRRYQLEDLWREAPRVESGRVRRMTSEGTSTVPRMGSFQRAFLGYRRPEVDAAIAARDSRSIEEPRAQERCGGRGRGRGRAGQLALGHGDRARA